MNKTIAIIIGVIVIGGGAFFAGMKYGQAQGGPSLANASGQRQGRFGQFGGNASGTRAFAGGGGTAGQIISKDATSITVKLRTGGSQIVFLSGSTQVMKADTGSLSDLSVGQEVTAMGTTNSDGSITAQVVQIRPAGSAVASSTVQR